MEPIELPAEPRTLVLVCHGPSCTERGSPETCRLLREAIASGASRRAVRVSETGCLDSCATGPNVLVASEGSVQTGVVSASVGQLVALLTGTAPAGAWEPHAQRARDAQGRTGGP